MSPERVLFVLRSENAKLGPVAASYTSASTCPDACPLKGRGCYASAGLHARMAWARADSHGLSWDAFVARVRALPRGAAFRHNVAGDLPGAGDRLAARAFSQLWKAARGLRAWTYTHKPLRTTRERDAIARANTSAREHGGLAVNLSADSLADADRKADWRIGPVVVTLPSDAPALSRTPAGRPVVVCPAQTGPRTCASCMACARADRTVVIGFRAHGARKAQVNARLSEAA